MVLIGSVHTTAFSHEKTCNENDVCVFSTLVLHVFRDSERDAWGWVGHKWQFQRDVII